MQIKIIAKPERLQSTDVFNADIETVREAIAYIGKTYNVKFSFAFYLKRDFNPNHYQKFMELCPPEYRSIEVANYLDAPKILTPEQNFTFHFRTLFNAPHSNGTTYDREVFPAGTEQHLLKDILQLNERDVYGTPYLAPLYNFLKVYKNNLTYISLFLGIAADKIEKAENGSNETHPEAIALSQAEIFQQVNLTLKALTQSLQELGYPGQILIRNLDYYPGEPFSSYAYVTEPEMLNSVLKFNNTGLYLDIGHMMITVHNLYHKAADVSNLLTYLNTLCDKGQHTAYNPETDNVEKVITPDYSWIKEIHFSVPDRKQERLYDLHEPIYAEKVNNKNDYEVAVETLKYILHNRPRENPLILHFGTEAVNAKADILTVIKDLAE